MSITVRPIGAADEASWRVLFQEYAHFYQTHFDESVISGVWSWLMAADHPERGFVAERDGDLVGFAHLQRQVDTFTAGVAWFLDDLYVAQHARRAGVARALLEALRSYATDHGGGDLRWITASDNHTAMALYDSLAKKTSWVFYEMPGGGHG